MLKKSRKNAEKAKDNQNPFAKTFIKVFLITTFIGIIVVTGVFVGGVLGFMGNIDNLELENFGLNFTSHIYYTDPSTGAEVELDNLYGEQNRVWVDFSKIPQNMKNAAIAIEDERFLKHRGFDLKRTTGALLNLVFKHDSSYGGSTITQQLIKNITGDKENSPMRKIQEISRAVNLERKISKDQILELYLNTIFLSQGCNGVQSAAKTYFNKDVGELSLAECASIIGITQFPTKYDPLISPEQNKEKQKLVLSKMLELKYISNEEYEQALNEPLNFISEGKGQTENGEDIHSYFVDQVINDVLDALVTEKGYSQTFANKLLFSGGLKIYSTYNPKVQNAVDKVYTDESNFPKINAEIKPQSAIVVMDPQSGAVAGIYGGIGKKNANRTLIRASQSIRQPGSSIKPIAVYAPALNMNIITPASVYDDKPITYGSWTPRNYDYKYNGPVSVKYAVHRSLNTVPVQIISRMGVDKSYDFLSKNLGITTLVEGEKRADGTFYSDKNFSSLALGGLTDGVSMLEMAAAYSPFANKGIYTKPYTFTKVLDNDNKELLTTKKQTHIAMTESTAYVTSQLLRGVVVSGTGGGAGLSNMFTAGKTGTTSDNYDRWFVGYTPYYVAAIWYGYDQPKDLGGGSNPCITVFRKIMTDIHTGLSYKEFSKPQDVVSASVCLDSGKIPTNLCSLDSRGNRVDTFYFVKGTVPGGTCDQHISINIDSATGMRSTIYCPSSAITQMVVVKDSLDDELYNKTCDVHTQFPQEEDIETHSIDGDGTHATSGQTGEGVDVNQIATHPPDKTTTANPTSTPRVYPKVE